LPSPVQLLKSHSSHLLFRYSVLNPSCMQYIIKIFCPSTPGASPKRAIQPCSLHPRVANHMITSFRTLFRNSPTPHERSGFSDPTHPKGFLGGHPQSPERGIFYTLFSNRSFGGFASAPQKFLPGTMVRPIWHPLRDHTHPPQGNPMNRQEKHRGNPKGLPYCRNTTNRLCFRKFHPNIHTGA